MLFVYLSAIKTQEDRDLFTSLYLEYKGFMFYVANKVLNDPHASEEIVHDAFIRMIENLEKFNLKNGHKTRGLIGIIVDGLAKNEYKRRKRLSPLDEETEETLAVPDDISEQIISREQYGELKKHIGQLDSIYKNTVLLKHLYGFSIKEISELEGVSADVVRQRLHRAKLKLRVLLAQESQTI